MAKKTIVPVQKESLPARREDLNPFALLRQEMNSLFDNFFSGFAPESFETRLGAFSPRVDIAETDKEIKVTAELPGMDDKDIDVALTRDMLTIRGEKKEEKEEKGKNYYRMERSYGSFSRSVPLPSEIDTNKVKADFKKGILTVTLPKTPQAIKETKKIQVKAE
jgi:HSP20 family protein